MPDLVRTDAPLTLIRLTYQASIEELDRLMPDHAAWLQKCIEEGVLIVAGRQVPRVGGVLIFRGHRDEVAALAATDPFVVNGAATLEAVEFVARFASDGFAALIQ
jgi:uncharacterized protein YciI